MGKKEGGRGDRYEHKDAKGIYEVLPKCQALSCLLLRMGSSAPSESWGNGSKPEVESAIEREDQGLGRPWGHTPSPGLGGLTRLPGECCV